MLDAHQLELHLPSEGCRAPQNPRSSRRGTFSDNMTLPVHRWFRYSAGFSADWARAVVAERYQLKRKKSFCVLDPFAGSGTALLAAEMEGVHAVGIEHHPFVARIARAKISAGQVNPQHLFSAGEDWVRRARAYRDQIELDDAPELLRRCYSDEALRSLDALRLTWHTQEEKDPSIKEILWLALTAVLRTCSGVGTAQWQYVLPKKTKVRAKEPFAALRDKVFEISGDISEAYARPRKKRIELRETDARASAAYADVLYDLVVTSPPYPNNYDYADATRIEMTFWREISGWGDLQSAVRHRLVRSCSQHSAAEKLQLEDLFRESSIAPIRSELASVCEQLAKVRLEKGGKKTYHTMIAAYFVDLGKVVKQLASCRKDTAEICMVLGDSAPYGIHVPVEHWLSELALAAGFTFAKFDKIRDRNTKWRNRKHRVPLKEGFLWLR